MDMHLIYEKSSSTHDSNDGRWATPRGSVLALFALVIAALCLALPGGAQAAAGSSDISAFTPGPATAAVTPLAASGEEPVQTEPATAITQISATLNASVDPNNAEVTECKFEYGTTTAYGSSVPCTQSPASLGTGTTAASVSAPVTGLTPNTPYHFSISDATMTGTTKTSSKGADATFTTLPDPAPTVVTDAASSVGQASATLNATVNPNGAEVSKCEFEYGTTTAYGSKAACAALPGSGTSPVAVSKTVTGLTVSTTYHFRITATNASGTSTGSDGTFTTGIDPVVVVEPVSELGQRSATLNATVNPNGQAVTKCEFEYGTTVGLGTSVACTPMPGSGTSAIAVSASVTGLAVNTKYFFKIIATSAGGTSDSFSETLRTLPEAPKVVTGLPSAVTESQATLNATVNPEGGEAWAVTECEFEYGTSTSYGSSVPCSSLPGSGSVAVGVSATVTGLAPNTPYHYRIRATNAGGTSRGSDGTFTTMEAAPTVVTDAASSVAETSATLNAAVNANGAEVGKCEFEYGTTTAYGSSVPCSSPPGSGTSAVAVSAPLTGLAASTTYHFRISATNAKGPSTGSDETFTTPTPPPPPPPPSSGSTGPTVVTSGLPATVLGHTANVSLAAGAVTVRLPGARAFVALSSPRQIPYGTLVDAIHGEISVTAATPGGPTEKGAFFDGEFVMSQGTNGRVLATLSGGDFNVCPPTGKTARRAAAKGKYASRTHLVRRLWAEASGNFSTKGRYANGVVKSAQWLTEDMCEGTLILATRERVEVNDLVRHRNDELATGGIYVAKPK